MLKLFRYLADKKTLAADAPADSRFTPAADSVPDSRLARDSELAAMPSTFAPLAPAEAVATEAPATDASPWSRFRSTELHALAESSFAWALDLPRGVRPTQLLVRYPRVANRIAVSWTDARLTDRVFDSLARSTREGRRGFPPHVAEELRVLHEHHEATRKDKERNQGWTQPRPAASPFPKPEPVTQPAALKPAYDDAWAAQATSDR